jgi:Ca-activated chloride channel family protein
MTTHDRETNERDLRIRIGVGVALLAITLAGGFAFAAAQPGDIASGDVASRRFAATAAGNVHFRGHLDRGAVLENGDGLLGMELVLAADDLAEALRSRIPTDLVVVLDRSGSMQGQPLSDALASVRELIGRLAPDDRFALVAYESGVQVAVPLAEASAQNRERWLATVAGIGVGGGTNMASGLDVAHSIVAGARQPGRMSRVILLSDGHANEGDASFDGLRARAARAVADEYVLSSVGVGQGFDEALMTALADAGTGNFYYVRDGAELGEVFAGEFDSARETVASALRVEIELASGVELREAAGYPIEQRGRTASFRPGNLFAGQERRIWLSLRAPTHALGDVPIGTFRLSYRDPHAPLSSAPRVVAFDERPRLACVRDEARYAASLDEDRVVRGIAEEKLALLKQRVAGAVRAGSYPEAASAIDAFKRENRADYGRLGLIAEESDSFRAADSLDAEVQAAFAPSAEPAARNALSKTLAAEGQDARRQGAKK